VNRVGLGNYVRCGLSALATINLSAKFEVSIATHYVDMKGDKTIENGVVWCS